MPRRWILYPIAFVTCASSAVSPDIAAPDVAAPDASDPELPAPRTVAPVEPIPTAGLLWARQVFAPDDQRGFVLRWAEEGPLIWRSGRLTHRVDLRDGALRTVVEGEPQVALNSNAPEAVTAERLFAFEREACALTAWDRATGAQRWSLDLTAAHAACPETPRPGTVVATPAGDAALIWTLARPPGPDGRSPRPSTATELVLIDGERGAIRARREIASPPRQPRKSPYAPELFSVGGALLTAEDGVVTRIDPLTGGPIWATDADETPWAEGFAVGPAGELVGFDEGTLKSLDLATGVVTERLELGRRLFRPDWVDGDLAIFTVSPSERRGETYRTPAIEAFDLKAGRAIWRVERAGRVDHVFFSADSVWLRESGDRLTRLDRASGEVIWSRQLHEIVSMAVYEHPDGEGGLVRAASPLVVVLASGGRLYALDGDASPLPSRTVHVEVALDVGCCEGETTMGLTDEPLDVRTWTGQGAWTQQDPGESFTMTLTGDEIAAFDWSAHYRPVDQREWCDADGSVALPLTPGVERYAVSLSAVARCDGAYD